MQLLLQVTDAFDLSWGLVLAPEIPFPDGSFKPFEGRVEIVTPDGARRLAEASFSLTHFNPGGFKLMVALPKERKESVPIGSKVYAGDEVHSRVGPSWA
jgi:hypothetical protein